jgi:hypothetical protein
VSTLEGCLGIMLDDAHISHSDLILGQKWGKIRTDAKIAVSPALDLEVSEIVARRNMIIHHNVQYDPGRYDLSRFRSAMCFTSGNETVPKRPGDSFTVNAWYVFHVLDTVGWLVDEVADGERRPVPS